MQIYADLCKATYELRSPLDLTCIRSVSKNYRKLWRWFDFVRKIHAKRSQKDIERSRNGSLRDIKSQKYYNMNTKDTRTQMKLKSTQRKPK